MLKILDDESAIRRCQRHFIRSLKPCVTGRISVRIGHPGESVRANVFWADDPGIWFHSKALAGDRFWNAFGLGKPSDGGAVSSTIEINIPILNRDRKLGGAFAQDDAGKVFLVHRGKIGGRKGIGKSLFEAHYRGVWSEVEDGDARSAVVVVGALHSSLFVRHLAQFIRKIEAIKGRGADDDQQARIFFDDDCFYEERIGGRYVPEKRDYASETDRDLAVLDLSHRLKELGYRAKGDPGGNLFACGPTGRISAVFEVLSGVATPVLEQGVARILLKNLNLPQDTRRILVVPGELENDREEGLLKLGIHVISYSWEAGTATFAGLAELLAGS